MFNVNAFDNLTKCLLFCLSLECNEICTVFYQTARQRGDRVYLCCTQKFIPKNMFMFCKMYPKYSLGRVKTGKPNVSYGSFGENRSVFIGAPKQRNFRVFCRFRNSGRSKSKQYVTDNTMSYIFK